MKAEASKASRGKRGSPPTMLEWGLCVCREPEFHVSAEARNLYESSRLAAPLSPSPPPSPCSSSSSSVSLSSRPDSEPLSGNDLQDTVSDSEVSEFKLDDEGGGEDEGEDEKVEDCTDAEMELEEEEEADEETEESPPRRITRSKTKNKQQRQQRQQRRSTRRRRLRKMSTISNKAERLADED